MSKYLIVKYKTNTEVSYVMFDVDWFGYGTMIVGSTQESIIKPRKYWYLHTWTEGDGWCDDYTSNIKLNVIEEFDTIEQVKEKYIIKEEPYKMLIPEYKSPMTGELIKEHYVDTYMDSVPLELKKID